VRAALADAGSTLDGISWPVLGILLIVALVAVTAHAIWRDVHDANRDRRDFEREQSDIEREWDEYFRRDQ
jgi:hypothetical protein